MQLFPIISCNFIWVIIIEKTTFNYLKNLIKQPAQKDQIVALTN